MPVCEMPHDRTPVCCARVRRACWSICRKAGTWSRTIQTGNHQQEKLLEHRSVTCSVIYLYFIYRYAVGDREKAVPVGQFGPGQPLFREGLVPTCRALRVCLPRRAAIVFHCPCTEVRDAAHGPPVPVGHRSCLRIHATREGGARPRNEALVVVGPRGASATASGRRRRARRSCAVQLCASTPYVRLAIRCRGVHFPRLFGSCRHVPRLVMAGPLRRT
jgi:hypothetical protein